MLTLLIATACFIAFEYIVLEYWGGVIGLPWAPQSWAFPVAGILLGAGVLLLLIASFLRRSRNPMASSANASN